MIEQKIDAIEAEDFARLKRQLIWAFDDNGGIDVDRFLSILRHEGYGCVIADSRKLAMLVEEISESVADETHWKYLYS